MPNSVRTILKKALHKGAISPNEYNKVMRNVVEVRCRDCKHYQSEVGDESFALGFCPFINSHFVMNEGYCCWGERKEVEDE